MKDNFSEQASGYVKYRPTYSNEMFEYILSEVATRGFAWDVGTGNGQVAVRLADYFQEVYATDISQQQLDQAPPRKNIQYQRVAAEQAEIEENHLDLVTVGQALHWFDVDRFYPIVTHSLKSGGIIALFGYAFLRTTPAIDRLLLRLYEDILGSYWDQERRLVEEEYKSLPFPFEEQDAPKFHYQTRWSLDHLLGYLNTWSATQHYIKKHQKNPVNLIAEELTSTWGTSEQMTVQFPIFIRLGKN